MNSGYLQLAGPNIVNLFTGNKGAKIFSNQKTSSEKIKDDKRNFVNRNMIFFSSSMNRHSGFFRKYNILHQNLLDYVQKISEKVFGGKSLNKNKIIQLNKMIEKTVLGLRKINYDEIMKIYCKIEKDKYSSLKNRIKQVLKIKKTEDNETGLNILHHYFKYFII